MIRKVLEFYFKYYYRFALDLASVNAEQLTQKVYRPLPEGLMFKILDKNDSGYFKRIGLKENYQNVQLDRLKNPEHHRCFAIIDVTADKLVYYSWTNSLRRYYHNEFESFYEHDGKSVLFEDSYTDEQYRKKGLYTYCMLQMVLYAKKAGFKKAIANIYFRNIPPLVLMKKLGFRKVWKFPISLRKGSMRYTYNKLFKGNE